MFIAGGAGITPFIAILKDLENRDLLGNNTLLFANKTRADIILEDRFRTLLASRFINILSDEKSEGYENGLITGELIKKNIRSPASYFYLCGPPPMMKAVENHLSSIGIGRGHIVKEEF
jgi:ferredoxin-NADP reductase